MKLICEFCLAKTLDFRQPMQTYFLSKLHSIFQLIKLTGITLISLTPDPVSERSLSLSGSEANRASDLFLRIDFDRLCVSLEPSKEFEEKKLPN